MQSTELCIVFESVWWGMNLEPITQSGSQKEKTIFYMLMHIYNQKDSTDPTFRAAKGDTHVKNRLLANSGRRRGMTENNIETYAYYM